MANTTVCTDTSEAIDLYEPQCIFLKPIAKVNICVQLPHLKTAGKTISNWEVMEKLKHMVRPEVFLTLKIFKSTMEFIRLEGEIENKGRIHTIILKLDGKTIKLSGFTDVLKVRAAEAKVSFPSKHDWDSYFRDNKMNEMRPGERPDTIHIKDLPTRWFLARQLDKDGSSELKPNEEIVRTVFNSFGEIRCVDIPMLDPYRKEICANMKKSNIQTFSFGQDLTYECFIQYKDYISFVKAMDSLRGMKLLYKGDEKALTAVIKVDFDKTKHLSEKNIRRRRIERDKLEALERERVERARREKEEEERKKGEERRKKEDEEKEKERKRQEKLQRKEDRRIEREEKRRQLKLEKKRKEEEERIQYKISLEERRFLLAQRKLESLRLLTELFERVKAIRLKKYIEIKEKELEEERRQQLEDEKKEKEEIELRKSEEETKKKLKLQKQEEELRNKIMKNFKAKEEQKQEIQREQLRKKISGTVKLKSAVVMKKSGEKSKKRKKEEESSYSESESSEDEEKPLPGKTGNISKEISKSSDHPSKNKRPASQTVDKKSSLDGMKGQSSKASPKVKKAQAEADYTWETSSDDESEDGNDDGSDEEGGSSQGANSDKGGGGGISVLARVLKANKMRAWGNTDGGKNVDSPPHGKSVASRIVNIKDRGSGRGRRGMPNIAVQVKKTLDGDGKRVVSTERIKDDNRDWNRASNREKLRGEYREQRGDLNQGRGRMLGNEFEQKGRNQNRIESRSISPQFTRVRKEEERKGRSGSSDSKDRRHRQERSFESDGKNREREKHSRSQEGRSRNEESPSRTSRSRSRERERRSRSRDRRSGSRDKRSRSRDRRSQSRERERDYFRHHPMPPMMPGPGGMMIPIPPGMPPFPMMFPGPMDMRFRPPFSFRGRGRGGRMGFPPRGRGMRGGGGMPFPPMPLFPPRFGGDFRGSHNQMKDGTGRYAQPLQVNFPPRQRGNSGSHSHRHKKSRRKRHRRSRDRSSSRSRSDDSSRSRSRSRERSRSRDRRRSRERSRSRDRDGDKDKSRSRSKDRRDRSRTRDRSRSRSRNKDKSRSRSRDKDRSRSRDKDRSRSRDKDRSRSRSRDKDRSRSKDRRDRSRTRDRSGSRERSRDRDRSRSKERRDRSRSRSRRRDRSRSGGREKSSRDRSRSREKSRSKDAEKSKSSERERNQEKRSWERNEEGEESSLEKSRETGDEESRKSKENMKGDDEDRIGEGSSRDKDRETEERASDEQDRHSNPPDERLEDVSESDKE